MPDTAHDDGHSIPAEALLRFKRGSRISPTGPPMMSMLQLSAASNLSASPNLSVSDNFVTPSLLSPMVTSKHRDSFFDESDVSSFESKAERSVWFFLYSYTDSLIAAK